VNESRWRVPLSDITVEDELVDAVLETIGSGWWSMPNAHPVDGTGSPTPSLNVFGDAEKRVAGQGS
jgi:hypothetical protein